MLSAESIGGEGPGPRSTPRGGKKAYQTAEEGRPGASRPGRRPTTASWCLRTCELVPAFGVAAALSGEDGRGEGVLRWEIWQGRGESEVHRGLH